MMIMMIMMIMMLIRQYPFYDHDVDDLLVMILLVKGSQTTVAGCI